MKNISKLFIPVILLLILISGCLKDKGFDDQKYGLQVVSVKGVAFPQASSSPLITGITGQAAAITVDGPLVTLELDEKTTTDVTITLEVDNTIATAAGLTVLPSGTYTVSPLSVVIPAGSKVSTPVKVSVSNSDVLNPSLRYGIGLKIISASDGYKIAANQNSIAVGFTIKNRYDGVYKLNGVHNRTPYTFPYETEVHMITQGPNSVKFYWPEVKSDGHPIGTGVGATSWYGIGISPVVEFDLATNLVSNVFNNPPQTTVISIYTGVGSGTGRFEPGTKKMYVYWRYSNNDLRGFMDTLTYISPRP